MLFYALTIFLSAFLLFQVQPLAGKMILPWFGGSASVWSACMVFFQTTLLGGYLYAHWLHTKLAPRKQAIVHGTLLALSLIVLPIAASPAWRDDSWGSPTLRVLGVLATSVTPSREPHCWRRTSVPRRQHQPPARERAPNLAADATHRDGAPQAQSTLPTPAPRPQSGRTQWQVRQPRPAAARSPSVTSAERRRTAAPTWA